MSDTVDIEDFLPEVLTHAPFAAELRAIRMVRQTAREFCTVTRIWRETDEFTVETPADAQACGQDCEIVEIERADLDGERLTPVIVDWLDDEYPEWRTLEDDAAPGKYITQLGPDRVTIVPPATGTLKLWLIVKPTRTATTLPAFLYNHHAELIGKGAAAALLNIAGENANPALAKDLRGQFERGMSGMRFKTAKGQQRAPLRTRANFM